MDLRTKTFESFSKPWVCFSYYRKTHFRDYIAERIAHEAINTLARAHYVGNNINSNPQNKDDDQITPEEAVRSVVKEEEGNFIHKLQLDELGKNNNQIIDGILKPDDMYSICYETFEKIKTEAENINVTDLTADSQEWIKRYQAASEALYEDHKNRAEKAVVHGAREWAEGIQETILDTTLEFISKHGAPVTSLIEHIENIYLEECLIDLKMKKINLSRI